MIDAKNFLDQPINNGFKEMKTLEKLELVKMITQLAVC